MALTPRGIYKLKPGKYWDQHTGGLVLDIKASGKASWYIRGSMYPAQGIRRDVTYRIGSLATLGLLEARKKAAPLIEKMKDGIHPKFVADEAAATLADAYRHWTEARIARRGSRVHVKNANRDAGRYTPDWLPLALSKIGPAMVADRYAAIARDHGPAASENWRKVFSAAWTIQRQRTPALPECPTGAIARPPQDKDRDRRTIPDLPAWWRATYTLAAQLKGVAFRFQLLSGLRSHNVFRLRRDWLDIPGRAIHFPASAMKSRRKFDLPLSGPMVALLIEAAAIWTGELVFAISEPGAESKPWNERGQSPLKGLTGHIIRHTYSNLLVEFEVDPIKQLLLMAHSVPGIKGVYVNAAAQFSALLKTQEAVSSGILKKIVPPAEIV